MIQKRQLKTKTKEKPYTLQLEVSKSFPQKMEASWKLPEIIEHGTSLRILCLP